MRWRNDKIGFDDRPVMAVGILLISFLVPIVFFGWRIGRPPYYPWDAYWTSLVITSITWMTCRSIACWARTRYPSFSQVKKRILIQYGTVMVLALLINAVAGVALEEVCARLMKIRKLPLPGDDTGIASVSATILCTLLVMTMYESVYFLSELKKSVEEKEMLKRESLQAQVNALKIQVNPHFLFNTLNTLAAVIPENPQQAVDFVQQLSKVYRHILEVKDEPSILLKEELEVLEAYAFLLKTRHGDNLAIHIRLEEKQLGQRIVPLSLQILMENAIKHNIVSAARPLRIEIYAEEDSLLMTNNLQRKHQSIESTGIGLDNIRNRYRLLGARPVEVEEGAGQFIVKIPLI
jgi:two-component system LytT family sensor kinase